MKAVHYAIVLGLICVAAALGLAGTYSLTKPHIKEKAAAESKAARQKVVVSEGSGGMTFEVMNAKAEELQQVVKAIDSQKNVLGYCALGEAQGYGGKIRVMVGMDAEAEQLTAVTVVAQSETPGLGTRVAEVESKKTWTKILKGEAGDIKDETTSEFLKQFQGLPLENIAVGNGIDAISGATISSKGVTLAVRNAAEKIVAMVHPEELPKVEPSTDGATGATPEGESHGAWKPETTDEK